MIIKRHMDKDSELAQHLTQQLNTPLDWPDDGGLNTKHIANIATAAACDVSYDQAANGHLVDLFAALPLPNTPEGNEFWASLVDKGGDASLFIAPANAGGPFFDYLINGNESGIAGRVLSFLEALDDQQHHAVAEVIGSALGHDTFAGSGRYIGTLWLRDAETTAWHVLLASRRMQETEEDRKRFLDAWRSA